MHRLSTHSFDPLCTLGDTKSVSSMSSSTRAAMRPLPPKRVEAGFPHALNPWTEPSHSEEPCVESPRHVVAGDANGDCPLPMEPPAPPQIRGGRADDVELLRKVAELPPPQLRGGRADDVELLREVELPSRLRGGCMGEGEQLLGVEPHSLLAGVLRTRARACKLGVARKSIGGGREQAEKPEHVEEATEEAEPRCGEGEALGAAWYLSWMSALGLANTAAVLIGFMQNQARKSRPRKTTPPPMHEAMTKLCEGSFEATSVRG